MAETEARFTLGPLERRGLVAGWRPGQVLVVATSAGCAGLVIALTRSPAGVVAAIALLVSGGVAASVPVGGRTIEEWVPSLVGFVAHRRRREVLRVHVGVDEATGAGVLEVPGTGSVVILAVESTGISLLDSQQRARRVDGLMAAVGALASDGGGLDRISWTASARHADGARLAADLRRRGARGDRTASAAYRSLLGAVDGLITERRVDVALRASSTKKLVEQATVVATALEESGHRRTWLLGPEEVDERLKDRLGEAAVSSGAERRFAGRPRFDRLEGPFGCAAAWWISRWPSTPVSAELLGALLLGDEHRAVTVVVEPVAPATARRRAAATRTSAVADAELRRRGGFLTDREGERRRAHTSAREDDLVDGYSSLRFAGYVSVTTTNPEELASLVTSTELAAAQSQLELRRLDGDHLRGVVATLPLALGLP